MDGLAAINEALTTEDVVIPTATIELTPGLIVLIMRPNLPLISLSVDGEGKVEWETSDDDGEVGVEELDEPRKWIDSIDPSLFDPCEMAYS